MRKGPEHKELIAARVFEYVLRHGLADLSLRPLANAVGLSPRVLLYHFGSKEQLVDGVLATVRAHNLEQFHAARPAEKESPGAAVLRLWDQLGRPENGPYLRLFFHAYGLALQHPARYPTFFDRVVGDWLGALGEAFGDRSSVPATAALAAIRGLLLDYLTTGDLDRTTEAARMLAAMLDGIAETTNRR
jgi:AcrR family transcriptional regulator